MDQETPGTWTTREIADKIRHLTSCLVCRERLRPASDQKLYAVKNARTRQFVHILVNGESLESKLGWSRDEILYSMLIEDGAPKGPLMSEEVKAKLREASEKRKAENKLKRLVRANTPARPVEGEEKESEVREMPTKKKAKTAKTAKKPKKAARAGGGFEARLPSEFVRRYKGVDYKVVKVGDGWQVDGGKITTIHEAMVQIVEKHQPINKDWRASGFFLSK